jgi:uncharacterized protein (TIGR02996 family)
VSESRPWLARYVGDSLRNAWMPFVHTVGDLSAASCGWGVLAVRDGGKQESPALPPDDSNRGRKALSPFVRDPFAPLLRTGLASLLLWCQSVDGDACEACNGRGVEEYQNIPCHECGGSGCWIPGVERKRPSLLAGVLLDRNRLAWLLAPELLDLPDEPVLVGACRTCSQAVVLETPHWRAVLMGLDEKVRKAGEVPPTFHPEPLFTSLWVEREDPADDFAARLVLADWLDDRQDPYAAVLRVLPEKEIPCPTT